MITASGPCSARIPGQVTLHRGYRGWEQHDQTYFVDCLLVYFSFTVLVLIDTYTCPWVLLKIIFGMYPNWTYAFVFP